MKKVLLILLALLLVTALASSCGGSSGGKSDPVREEAKRFTVGTVASNVYTSEYFGIAVELAEVDGWHFYSDEEMRKMNKISDELVGTDYTEALEAADVIYDMMATDGTSTVNVLVENMGEPGSAITVENYIDPQLGQLKDALESSGYSDVEIERKTYTFAGAQRRGIYVQGIANTAKFEEAIIVLKNGERFAVVTFFTMRDDLDELVSKFYAL